MGSHGAVGKGGGGKEKGNPGIVDPGAAAAAAAVAESAVVDELGWLLPDGNKTRNTVITWMHVKHSQSRSDTVSCRRV